MRHEQLTVGQLLVNEVKFLSEGLDTGFGTAKSNVDLKSFWNKEALADDAEFDLPDAVEGFALVTDGTEFLIGHVGTDGAVVALVTSTNAAATDSDTDLCLYDNGTNASVKNRLGSEKTVTCLFFYVG